MESNCWSHFLVYIKFHVTTAVTRKCSITLQWNVSLPYSFLYSHQIKPVLHKLSRRQLQHLLIVRYPCLVF